MDQAVFGFESHSDKWSQLRAADYGWDINTQKYLLIDCDCHFYLLWKDDYDSTASNVY